jgi:hypothetical protein
MSDEDLLLKVDKGPPKQFSWDRALSISALVISLVAAGGTVWQARIAEQARKDVLALAQDKPVIHIVGSSLQFIPKGEINSFTSSLIGVSFTLKNEGRAPAKTVFLVTDRHTIVNMLTKNVQNLIVSPESTMVAQPLPDGKELDVSPLGFKKYSPDDNVRLSGVLDYLDENGSWSHLPWCYQFIAPGPPPTHVDDIHVGLTDCVAVRDSVFDSQKR